MKTITHTAALALAIAVAAPAVAQNSVDIALVPGMSSTLDVRIRFENDFDGFFAASVFTIRWSDASGAHLGTLAQDPGVQEYHYVNKSGAEVVSGGYRYQFFAGFGASVLSDIPLTLMAGEWITLCTIAVIDGQDAFSIVNDDPYVEVNNGTYYISLGGQESQGDIVDLGTGVAQGASRGEVFSADPSVTNGAVQVDLDLENMEGFDLSLSNAVGQEVWSRSLTGSRGPLRYALDLSDMETGLYLLRLRTAAGDRTLRLVKR